jgi:hypothetical protein
MAAKLNAKGFDHAKALVAQRRVVVDDRDLWSEHQPSTEAGNRFIAEHGIAEYGNWHLGIDPKQGKEAKGHYLFPYGDFEDVHRCGVLAVESRAGQYNYRDIRDAAAHLHGILEGGAVMFRLRRR